MDRLPEAHHHPFAGAPCEGGADPADVTWSGLGAGMQVRAVIPVLELQAVARRPRMAAALERVQATEARLRAAESELAAAVNARREAVQELNSATEEAAAAMRNRLGGDHGTAATQD